MTAQCVCVGVRDSENFALRGALDWPNMGALRANSSPESVKRAIMAALARGYVLPVQLDNGHNEPFSRPERIADLHGLYRRHRKIAEVKSALSISRTDIGEFNLLIKFHKFTGLECDTEFQVYLANGRGEPISEAFLAMALRADANKPVSRDCAGWCVLTNIFYKDLRHDDLHLVVQAVTVRRSLKAGAKKKAPGGVSFRQPLGISCLQMPSAEITKLVASWANGAPGAEAEVGLEFVGAPEKIFPDLAAGIIQGRQEAMGGKPVRAGAIVRIAAWYGMPCLPTLPKDTDFTDTKRCDFLLIFSACEPRMGM